MDWDRADRKLRQDVGCIIAFVVFPVFAGMAYICRASRDILAGIAYSYFRDPSIMDEVLRHVEFFGNYYFTLLNNKEAFLVGLFVYCPPFIAAIFVLFIAKRACRRIFTGGTDPDEFWKELQNKK